MRQVVIAAALVLAPSTIHAEEPDYKTGQELHAACKTVDPPGASFDSGVCLGFLSATLQSVSVVGVLAEEILDSGNAVRASLACSPPDETTVGQVLQAFMNHAEAHPEDWQQPAYNIVMEAIDTLRFCP